MSSNLLKMHLFPCLLVLGCAGQAIDFGGEQATPPSFEGTWVGELSSGAVLSGSKPISLTLDASGHGTLLVGKTASPPPTDPKIGYPEEAEQDAAVASGLAVHLYDGVSYTLDHVSVKGGHLSFQVDALKAFEPLCALQTPIQTDQGYRCLEQSGGAADRNTGSTVCYQPADVPPTSPERQDVDCLVLFLCGMDPSRGCRCTETSCSVSDGGVPVVGHFELDLDPAGTELAGTHSLDEGDSVEGEGPLNLTRLSD